MATWLPQHLVDMFGLLGDSCVQVVKRGDKGKSKGKGKTTDASRLPSAAPVNARPGAKQSGNKGQASARLMPSSFPDGALIPREFLLQELKKGKAPENKWAWVASKQEANETKELAVIHKLSVKVGLLYQTTDDSDSATTVKLPVLRAGQITIEEFKIAPLTGDVPGKLGQTVRKSSAQPVQRKLATFRCTLPKEFAKEGAWKDASSNIQKVIRQFCSDDAFHSSYQWQRRECWSMAGHCDEYLEGYVRIVDEHADKFARMSGRSGCFFERLSREQKKPLVQLVRRQENESSSTYFSRVERAAKEAQQPAAFRKGGRDSLGIKYLTGAGRTELEVLAPPRRGQGWRIRGVNPGDVSDFVEAVEVGKHILVIQRCTGAKPTKITTHPLRKVFGDGGPSGHKTRAAMQTDSGEAETTTADSHKQEGDASSKKRATVTKGPDSKRSKHDSFDGYTVRDCGGIRVEVQQHVKRHPETYKSAWAKDPQWTEVSEGGSVPENYQQWGLRWKQQLRDWELRPSYTNSKMENGRIRWYLESPGEKYNIHTLLFRGVYEEVLQRCKQNAAEKSDGNMLWTCCACHQDVRAATLHTLSKRRSNHLRNAHPGEDRSKFNSIRVRPGEVMVADLPMHQRAWTCSKCRLGLPVMDVWILRKWAISHLAKWFKRKISMRENRKRLTSQSISHSKDGPQLHHYSKDRMKRFVKVKASLEKKSGHKLILVKERYAEGATLLTCTSCTSIFGCLKRATRSCGGQQARLRNLSIKATWWAHKWKHDRATLVRMCSRWRLTEQEAKHAMERARLKCKRLTGGLTPLKKTEYIKDLTVDEDVEENPGPSSLRCATLNACGRDHAWQLLSAEYLDACDILCVQELGITSSQLTCFERQLQKLGFMVWASPAFQDNGKFCHGLLLAVRQSYRVRHVASFAAHAGHFVALQVAGCVFVGVHHKPWIMHGQSFEDEIASLIASMDPDQLWAGFGDWNALPRENLLQAVFHDDGATSVAQTDSDGNWLPTRWKGRRAIDYAVTNTPGKLQCVTSWDAVFGDHKVIEFAFHVREQPEVAWSLPATCKYRCPDGMTGHDWTEALRQAWLALVSEVPDTDTEDEWCWFNRRLEEMFQHAGSMSSGTAGKRPKGTAAVLQPRRLQVTVGNEGDKSTHLERRWRTVIGRLRHLQSLPERCTEQRRLLIEKIQRTRLAEIDFSRLPYRISQILAEAETRLREVTREAERRRLGDWRQRMRSSAAYKWIKGVMTCLPNHVFAPANPDVVSGTTGETLLYIKTHWRSIWDRTTVAWSDVQASFRFPDARAHHFTAPSASDLRQAAQRLRGRAGGLDGWHGDEVAAIPDEAWNVFQALVQRWFQRARDGHDSPFPHDWRVIRQTHIPKTEAQEERQPWVPLGLEDFSEAFDRADPTVAIHALASAGMAPEVASLVSYVDDRNTSVKTPVWLKENMPKLKIVVKGGVAAMCSPAECWAWILVLPAGRGLRFKIT
ncbi:hypothetical protein AK812_SmicGene2451 [Symbiodinium microadriaticum]|uniref:Endonuclease/exonuclease/phosphatase domain-containing protein n=1 Tax=Symbiodinium microadriaticum TaxID=2951 RepID=A0A1Q9F1J0_SYMMI|nr:hypothetical protein AK812_SmicGene2451 [Symbiodinium microadriaticum]